MSEQQVNNESAVADEPAARWRPRFPIAFLLGVTLAGLVGLTVGTVIVIDFFSARAATLSLLHEKGELVLGGLEQSVRDLMMPAEEQLAFLAETIVRSGDGQQTRLIDLLTGSLAAVPQVVRISFIDPSGSAIVVQRGIGQATAMTLDLSGVPAVRTSIEDAAGRIGGYWGELIYDEVLREPLINRRFAVWRDGRFIGVLGAFVSTHQLSDTIALEAATLTGTRFILYDRDRVLAHARMAEASIQSSSASPLPSLAALGDPVLANIWGPPVQVAISGRNQPFHVVEVDGERYAFLQRILYNFGATPWRLGVYYRAADIGQELRRLVRSALAGFGVLLISVVCAIILGRKLARPMRRLAEAANALQASGYSRLEALPRSRVREIDDQIRAFNAMQSGLRWFRAYVPRTVVRRLMTQPEGSVVASRERDVTVMFTDIVGFTSMSETMDAADVAALLNHHFEIVTRAVEEELGTVDKFIGDSVMAFWNAPKHQDDHAERAVRAAQAIGQALRADNTTRIAAGGTPIRIRIGIHTGPVVVGNIGAPGRVNYTAVGDTVNTAQRLQSLGRELCRDADDAGILVSGATVERLPPGLPLVSVGMITLRGRADPVAVYRLATTAADSRVARAAAGRAP